MKNFTKTINGNKYQGRLFEESDIVNKFGKSKEDWELINTYQKTFPQLLLDDTGDFVIDARVLWSELGEPQGVFSNWIKRKMIDVYELNSDYEKVFILPNKTSDFKIENVGSMSASVLSAHGISTNYSLTLETSKSLSLGVGATKSSSLDVRQRGTLVRKYFMLIEKVLKEYESWENVRHPEKEGNKKMRKAIGEWCRRKDFDYTDNTFYSRENNMLNKSLTGFVASEMNSITNTYDKQTRDNLDEETNKGLDYLQFFNIGLLAMDLDFKTRTEMIEKVCDGQFKHIKEKFNNKLKGGN